MQEFFRQLFDGQLSLLEGQVLVMLVGIPLIVLIRRALKHKPDPRRRDDEVDTEPEIKVNRIPRDPTQ